MNLTSKRLLQFFAGCVGVCAFTAAAGTQYLVDTFDEDNVIYYTAGGTQYAASNGMDIAHYKGTLNSGDLTFFTNSWFAATGDASALTNVTPNISDLNKKPLAGGTLGHFVLNLETEGQTLTRGVDAQPDILSGDVYVDTLIKFTPSEDAPTIASDVKAAVYVNVSSNLVIHHGGSSGVGITAGDTDVGVAIDPAKWYRLTVMLHKLGDDTPVFKVYLDNVAVTSSDNAIDDDFYLSGSWFYTANQDSDTLMKAVAFQGTGMIDELVVADEVNALTPPTGVLLTIVYNSGLATVTAGTSGVANGGTVASGTAIHIDAIDWYEIASITGATYPEYAGDLSSSNFLNSATVTLSSTTSAVVNVGFRYYTGSIDISALGSSVTAIDASKLSAWAIANNKSENDVNGNLATGGSWLDDYLMNVAPNTNAKLLISSIEVGATEAIIVVTSDKTDVLTSFAGINGTLKYYTTSSLTAGFSGTGTAVSVVGAGTSVTVHIPLASGQFIKAVIE